MVGRQVKTFLPPSFPAFGLWAGKRASFAPRNRPCRSINRFSRPSLYPPKLHFFPNGTQNCGKKQEPNSFPGEWPTANAKRPLPSCPYGATRFLGILGFGFANGCEAVSPL